MASNPTISNTHTSSERIIAVPMSGDDYDICTPLLRRLCHAEIIYAFAYEETLSAATIYYTARPEAEISSRDENDIDQAEGTPVAQ